MRNAGKEDEVMRFCGMAKLKLCGRAREREDEGRMTGWMRS